MEKENKLERNLIYFITFFLSSGYYAGLAILISLGYMKESRMLYSIPVRLLSSVAMLYIIVVNFQSVRKTNLNNIIVIFIFFWLLYFIKVLYHVSIGFPLFRNMYDYILYPVNYCILPFGAFASINFNKYKKIILNALILSGFLMACTCLYLYRDWLSLGLGRISDINYTDPNAEFLSPLSLSYTGALTIMLCCYYLFFEKSKLKTTTIIYLLINIVVSFYIFLLGSSRGSLVAIIACIPLFLLYLPMRKKRQFILLLGLSIPIVVWAIVKSGSSILDRVSGTLESGNVTRGELWSNAWNEFLNYPLLGNRIEISFYPHNFILETLMATGIVGLFLLLPILFTGIKRVYRISFSDKIYLIPFIVLLQGVCQYSFSGALYCAILLFFPLGIIFSSYNRLSCNKKPV